MTEKKREAQPPIGRKIIGSVDQAIDRMEAKQIALAKQHFTFPELLTLFIHPDHHEPLQTAYELCEPSGRTQDLFSQWLSPAEHGAAIVHLRFHWSGGGLPNAFYVPYLCGAQMDHSASIRPEAPEDLQDRLRQTVYDMIGTHYRFAQVRKVLAALNRNAVCPSLASMRYHWPCIVPILRDARQGDLAEEVADPMVRAGDVAQINHELRRKLAPTNQTVAAHQLVADLPTPPAPPIAYEIRHNFR